MVISRAKKNAGPEADADVVVGNEEGHHTGNSADGPTTIVYMGSR